jgi:DNA polymerase-3 subunit alpha
LGEGAIEIICDIREKCENKKFESLFHFCRKGDLQKVNRRVLESLVKCGAFDLLEADRAQLFSLIPKAMEYSLQRKKEESLGQVNLFNVSDGQDIVSLGFSKEKCDSWTENQKLAYEKEALGFYFSGHPLKSYESEILRVSTSNTQGIKTLQQEAEVLLAGMVAQSKIITTKKGSRMAFLTFEDLIGNVETIVFSDVFQKHVELFSLDKPLILKASVDRAEDGVKLIAREFHLLEDFIKGKTRSVHVKVPAHLITDERVNQLSSILSQYAGSCQSYLHVIDPGQSETVLELPYKVNLDARELVTDKINHLFGNKVVEYTV